MNGLSNLEGLSSFVWAGSKLTIRENRGLTSLEGLDSLCTLRGLEVSRNPASRSIGWAPGLYRVGESLHLKSNEVLADLAGLSELQWVAVDLVLEGNPSLENLDDLSALTWVGGSLYIHGMEALVSLEGMAALEVVGSNLFISGNESLCQSDAEAFGAKLSVTGITTISDNGSARTDCL